MLLYETNYRNIYNVISLVCIVVYTKNMIIHQLYSTIIHDYF